MTAPALEVEYCCRRCEQITRAEAANFYYGIRLLPRDKRWAMSAVYAFARRVDDIGDDGSLSTEEQLDALAAERMMLSTLQETNPGRPTPVGDPVRVALGWARGVYDLPVEALEFLVEGVELDARGVRYETFEELVGYCRRVAGAVGRLCVAIFADGDVSPEVDGLADDLGIAMQLTNILRDILEDQRMGRIYLPAEDLSRFGCPDLMHSDPAACAQLIRFEAARATQWFDRGLELTAHLDARSASCVLAMTGIYRTILQRIVADPGQVLRTRVSLATWEKAWVAARSLASSRAALAGHRAAGAASWSPPARTVTIVGGGLSGITAALDCAAAGATVTLLESRGRLGGAAYSFDRDGLRADNGQHVFLRCCTAYAELVHRLGADDLVTVQPRLRIDVLAPGVDGGRVRRGRLGRSGLPAPLHLAGALLRYPFLSLRQRVATALTMRALDRVDVEDPANDERSFGDWLRDHGADARSVAVLWELITRPTLNLSCADASLAQAAQVFQLGLLRDPAAGDIGHAAVPLSEIHDVAARRGLAAAGVEVRLRSGVAAIEPGFAVTLSGGGGGGGETLRSDAVILAVGPERAAGLVPAGAGVDPAALRSLGESPIVNLHVVYDRPVLDAPFAAGVDTPVQWVFDRTASAGLDAGQYLVVTLSAADEELAMSADAVRERLLPALAALLPAARSAVVLRSFVTRDHAATFRASPGARAHRPAAATALPGLALAGAHTDTGWPATMEGAVRSGHAAADVVMAATVPAGLSVSESSLAGEPAVSLTTGTEPAAASPKAPNASRAAEPVVVLAPMSVEARAVRSGAPWAQVQKIGMGPKRAARSAAAAANAGGRAVLIAGFCGALDPELQPGDVVLASELRGPSGETLPCADPAILAGVLRRHGMRVHVGPIASSEKVVRGRRRRELQRTGALGVDMESVWLAPGIRDRPLLTLRVVLDTGTRELHRPLRTITGVAIAYRALRRACALAEEWTHALDARDVVLASPRASCAGVDRAIEIVARALEDRGAPVYVRKQIVHNAHVVQSLEARGAVFVEDVEEVPRGATIIFSAHGVSPEVRHRAGQRELDVIDATCPLVSKVHAEARRFADSDFDIVLVGHEGHEEVDGTYGEAPERTHVIATAAEVADLQVTDPQRVGYLTQTTLAVDETAEVVDALRARFPAALGPPSSDICYATQNRQDAVRALAAQCDLIVVVGSANSSNSRRLVEVAQRAGCPSLLVEAASEIPPSALIGTRRIGLTAGASAPEALVQDVVRALHGLGAVNVTEHRVATEKMHFKLPPEVRQQRSS